MQPTHVGIWCLPDSPLFQLLTLFDPKVLILNHNHIWPWVKCSMSSMQLVRLQAKVLQLFQPCGTLLQCQWLWCMVYQFRSYPQKTAKCAAKNWSVQYWVCEAPYNNPGSFSSQGMGRWFQSVFCSYGSNQRPNIGGGLVYTIWAPGRAYCKTGGRVYETTAASPIICHAKFEWRSIVFHLALYRSQGESLWSPTVRHVITGFPGSGFGRASTSCFGTIQSPSTSLHPLYIHPWGS